MGAVGPFGVRPKGPWGPGSPRDHTAPPSPSALQRAQEASAQPKIDPKRSQAKARETPEAQNEPNLLFLVCPGRYYRSISHLDMLNTSNLLQHGIGNFDCYLLSVEF